MSRGSQSRSSSWWRDVGRSEVGWAVVVGILVADTVAALGGGLVNALIRSVADVPSERDQALRFVLASVLGLAALGISLVAAWIGGRVARRMTVEPEVIPRVARIYAWALCVLGCIAAMLWWIQIARLERLTSSLDSDFARTFRPDVLNYGLLVALVVIALVSPAAGRAGVLRSRRRTS